MKRRMMAAVLALTLLLTCGLSGLVLPVAAANPNLLMNGDFESGTAYWGSDIPVQQGVGKDGSAGVVLTNPNGTLEDYYYRPLTVQPSTTYVLEWDYLATPGAEFRLYSGVMRINYHAVAGNGITWRHGLYTFTTPEDLGDYNKNYVLAIVSDAEGTTAPSIVDNVSLRLYEDQDLAIESVTASAAPLGQVKPNKETYFTVNVKNDGTVPIAAGETMKIDICLDGDVIQTIPYTFTSALQAGAGVAITGTEAWTTVVGDYTLSARLNTTLSIWENNRDNNTAQMNLRVNDTAIATPYLAEKAGFTTLGFNDDFYSIDTVDSLVTGEDGYKWYVTRPYGSATATADAYSVDDGILTLKDPNPAYNMTLTSLDYRTGKGFQWNKGYMETRIRIPRPRENVEGETGVPAIWSLPLDKLQGQHSCQWVEMDWMEYWGITDERPGGYYTITMHDMATDENDEVVRRLRNGNPYLEGLGDGEWHTMSWMWMDNLIVGYVDGVEVYRTTYSPTTDSNPSAYLITDDGSGKTGALSYMNEQWLALHIGGSADNNLEMDYLRIWTGDGDGEQPEEAVKSLSITTKPNKTTFYRNEALDTTGMKLRVRTGTFSYSTITSGYGVTGYDSTKLGKQTLTVTYGGMTATYEVTVIEDVLQGIAVEELPNKTTYFVGDNLDTTGLRLKPTYASNYDTIVVDGYTVSGFDSTTAGEKTVTVTYQGKTTTFAVTVVEPQLTSIAVQAAPNKTAYFVGDSLVTDGLSLLLTYENGKTETVTSGYTVSDFDSTMAGQKTVTVSYGGQNTTFVVSVAEPQLAAVTIATAPNKTAYLIGDALATDGLTLTLTYENGKTETVTKGYTVSGFDSTIAGTVTVTVTYAGFTDTFTATIVEDQLLGIEVEKAPNKTTYFIGDKSSYIGLKLRLLYGGGITKTATSGYIVRGFSTQTVGEKTLTVEYGGFTATFTITVVEPQLTAMAIKTVPTKTAYNTGEDFEADGLSLLLTYENGKTATVTEGYTLSAFDNQAVGQQTITVTYEAFMATFTVDVAPAYTSGDVNNDGTVNNKDLGLLSRYLTGWNVNITELAADVNRDGSVNNKDLGLLSRYLTGWNVTLK